MVHLCEAPDMPTVATIFRWLRDHEDFRAMYVIAKQTQAELLVDEALAIVDDASSDLMVDKKGRTVVNRAALQRCKMRIAFRQWTASKLLPSRYGNSRASSPPPPPSPAPTPPEPGNPSAPATGQVMTLERMRAMQARRMQYIREMQRLRQEAANNANNTNGNTNIDNNNNNNTDNTHNSGHPASTPPAPGT